VVVAVVVRLGPLQRGLGFDELFTAIHFVGVDSLQQTAATWLNLNNHVAFSLMAKVSVDLFGRSEWALRLPALLIGLASLVVLWRLARPIVGVWAALAATAGLALSPEHVRWSTSARGYTGLMLGVMLTSWLLLALLRRPRPMLAVWLALATAASTYFHLYAAIVVVVVQGPFLLAVLLWRRSDPAARRGVWLGMLGLFSGGLLSLVLYLPVMTPLIRSIQAGGRGSFWPGLAWSTAQEQSAAAPDWVVWMVLALAAVGLWRIYRTHSLVAAYTVALLIVPVVVVIAVQPADQYARYFAYDPPFLLAAVAAGGVAIAEILARSLPVRLRLLAWAPAVVGAGILLWSWSGTFADYQVDEGFRDGVQALEAGAVEGTALCAVGAGAELFQWYAHMSLPLPKTVNELQQVGRRSSELRCIARPASWESRSNTDVRRYVEERSTAERFGDTVVYRLRGRQ